MTIEFIPAVCPKCGGELRVPSNAEKVKCMYCGIDIVLNNPNRIQIEQVIDISKVLASCEMAIQAKNYEEGFYFSSSVLDQEPGNQIAIMNKGYCAGMLSTVISDRYDESMYYLRLSNWDFINEERDQILQKGISLQPISDSKLKQKLVEYYIDLGNHFVRIAGNASGNRIVEFLRHGLCFYTKAYDLSDLEKISTEYIYSKEHIAKIFQNNFEYMLDTIHNHASQVRREYQKDFAEGSTRTFYAQLAIANVDWQSPIHGYVSKEIDAFEKREAELLQKKKCYIATATMNDENHPYVETLRLYRDGVLSRSFLGRVFIKSYYFLSPKLARTIASSNFLRQISLRIIVYPSYLIAKKVLVHKNE